MIPEAQNKKTLKEIRKAKRSAYYRLRTDLNGKIEALFPDLDEEALENMLKSYMTMMTLKPEEGDDSVEMNITIVQQMALLCAQQMVVQLVKRYSV